WRCRVRRVLDFVFVEPFVDLWLFRTIHHTPRLVFICGLSECAPATLQTSSRSLWSKAVHDFRRLFRFADGRKRCAHKPVPAGDNSQTALRQTIDSSLAVVGRT